MSNEKTLIILNPQAGSGRAGRVWSEIEPLLWQELGQLVVAITQRPQDVAVHLDKARDAGLTRVIAIGGDGTNHVIINAIQKLAEKDPTAPKMTFGQLPIGTGQDFARTIGVPFDPKEAVKWIAHATPKPLDIGHVTIDDKASHFFINIASAGMGGDVAERVNRKPKRYPWTFHLATVQTLFSFKLPHLKIWLDGELWYDDKSWSMVVANGQVFGHGMKVAPYAALDDGMLDVIAFEPIMPRLHAAWALNTIYSGKHILRKDVHYRKAKEIIVESPDGVLGMELDGEQNKGEHLKFTVREHALNMLMG